MSSVNVPATVGIDYDRVRTPPDHGDVLIEPAARLLPELVRRNAAQLASASVRILGRPLPELRQITRSAVVGENAGPLVVLGHQPEFIHAGVWAKFVVADRLARSLGGAAVHIVADSDSPRDLDLRVPVIEGAELRVQRVRTHPLEAGQPYEVISPCSADEITGLSARLQELLGNRYERSLAPTFLQGARAGDSAGGWVEQLVNGRRAVDAEFELAVLDRRISRHWCSSLMLDIITNASAFAASYNRALESYRRSERIRNESRPMPNMLVSLDRTEVPLWVYGPTGPRRRLFVSVAGDRCCFWADSEKIGTCGLLSLQSCEGVSSLTEVMPDWRFRPRALTLTLWARLMLSDLFIHGVGGAKYDAITDRIIADYYGIAPPAIACVSATLLLDLPVRTAGERVVRDLAAQLRDTLYNPQRNFHLEGQMAELAGERRRAVSEAERLKSDSPRDRQARRAAFDRIREISQRMHTQHTNHVERLQSGLRHALKDLQRGRVARDRTFFFALFTRSELAWLCDRLPHFR